MYRKIAATIEGLSGVFFGIVCKSSGLPDGYGIFCVNEWVHCGKVKDGLFPDGRMVSVKRNAKILKLTNKTFLNDGSVLKKVEIFSP